MEEEESYERIKGFTRKPLAVAILQFGFPLMTWPWENGSAENRVHIPNEPITHTTAVLMKECRSHTISLMSSLCIDDKAYQHFLCASPPKQNIFLLSWSKISAQVTLAILENTSSLSRTVPSY